MWQFISFIKAKKLWFIAATLLVLVAVIISRLPGSLLVLVNQTDFNLSVNDSGGNQNLSTASHKLILPNGTNTIEVSKDGYYPVKTTIHLPPVLQQELKFELKPKSIVKDIREAANSTVVLKNGSKVSFCDRFENTVCIDTPEADKLNYQMSNELLNSVYSKDENMPPTLMRNSANNEVFIIEESELKVKLGESQVADRPVMIVTSADSLSLDNINQKIKEVVGPNYSYYTDYQNTKLRNSSTLPGLNDVYWYNEEEQHGAHDE